MTPVYVWRRRKTISSSHIYIHGYIYMASKHETWFIRKGDSGFFLNSLTREFSLACYGEHMEANSLSRVISTMRRLLKICSRVSGISVGPTLPYSSLVIKRRRIGRTPEWVAYGAFRSAMLYLVSNKTFMVFLPISSDPYDGQLRKRHYCQPPC